MQNLECEARIEAGFRPAVATETLLERLFGSLVEPRVTPAALDTLRRSFGVNHVALIFRSADDPSRVSGMCICMDSAPAEYESRYLNVARAKDPFVNLPIDRVVAIQDFIDETSWEGCEFYRDFLQPMGVFHVMGADLLARPDLVCSLRLCRSREQGRFQPYELAELQRLLPHLRQFVRLRAALSQARMAEHVLEGLMAQLGLGAVVMDGQSKVVHLFGAASAMTQSERRLYLSAGELKASSPANDRKLQRALHQVASAGAGTLPGAPRAVLFDADQHGTALGVSVRSMPVGDAAGGCTPGKMVVYRDAGQELDVSEENLQALFELTAAEARLGRLMIKGLSIDEAAQVLGVSRNTLRTHLRSLFSKTNTSRQADLVRELLGGTSLLC